MVCFNFLFVDLVMSICLRAETCGFAQALSLASFGVPSLVSFPTRSIEQPLGCKLSFGDGSSGSVWRATQVPKHRMDPQRGPTTSNGGNPSNGTVGRPVGPGFTAFSAVVLAFFISTL